MVTATVVKDAENKSYFRIAIEFNPYLISLYQDRVEVKRQVIFLLTKTQYDYLKAWGVEYKSTPCLLIESVCADPFYGSIEKVKKGEKATESLHRFTASISIPSLKTLKAKGGTHWMRGVINFLIAKEQGSKRGINNDVVA